MPCIQPVAVDVRPHLLSAACPPGVARRARLYPCRRPAKGHLAALKKLEETPGCKTYNLGTGVGYSVLEMLAAYSKAAGKELKHVMADRRPGDVSTVYGACDKALNELGWKAELGLEDMCADSWRWISNNPNGYD